MPKRNILAHIPHKRFLPSIDAINDDSDCQEKKSGHLSTIGEDSTLNGNGTNEESVDELDGLRSSIADSELHLNLGSGDEEEDEEDVDDEPKKLPKEIYTDRLTYVDSEYPPDPETQRNTLHNALMYQLSDDELNELKRSGSAERLMLSPELNAVGSHDSGLLSSDEDQLLTNPTPMSLNSSTHSILKSPYGSPSSFNKLGNSSSGQVQEPVHHKREPLTADTNFEKGVSFDTLNNEDVVVYKTQFILVTKHQHFKFNRTSKTFLVGYEPEDEASQLAIRWTIDELLSDGDTMVCLVVLPTTSKMITDESYHHKEGEKMLARLAKMNYNDKKLKIVLEYKVGEVSFMIRRAIREYYDCSALIVGMNDVQKPTWRSLIGSAKNKTIAKYFLQYSRIPIVVVNPFYIPRAIIGGNKASGFPAGNPAMRLITSASVSTSTTMSATESNSSTYESSLMSPIRQKVANLDLASEIPLAIRQSNQQSQHKPASKTPALLTATSSTSTSASVTPDVQTNPTSPSPSTSPPKITISKTKFKDKLFTYHPSDYPYGNPDPNSPLHPVYSTESASLYSIHSNGSTGNGRISRFMRIGGGSRESSASRDRSRSQSQSGGANRFSSPVRTMSPFRFLKRKVNNGS
ncbi:unnamed protein product [Ambrosiozyma monospora]|uniref:Unnamed protein product n=1 Tax=Ambrosiozyma monospora TaxID=43982 RepID=A0A9W6YS68_AMBMO|nr:unnamed protein product [Ambrosiozyma monospora]